MRQGRLAVEVDNDAVARIDVDGVIQAVDDGRGASFRKAPMLGRASPSRFPSNRRGAESLVLPSQTVELARIDGRAAPQAEHVWE